MSSEWLVCEFAFVVFPWYSKVFHINSYVCGCFRLVILLSQMVLFIGFGSCEMLEVVVRDLVAAVAGHEQEMEAAWWLMAYGLR